MSTLRKLKNVHARLRDCQACPQMCSRAVHGPAIETKVMLVGQAPGAHESDLGRPFAYTAGKTLFKWLGSATGLDEEELRERIYFTAVARCFPGKSLKGSGDREPSDEEISRCRPHLQAEMDALKPELVLAVGKVAITEVLGPEIYTKKSTLAEVVGRRLRARFLGHEVDVIALPHPSGVSTWPQTEPGKTKLRQALKLLEKALPALWE
jgi:uracil-DNA glycosylase